MGTYDRKLYKILGNQLRELREQKGYSLEYVAEKIGKTKKTVSRYELGEHRIDVETVKDICNALEIDYESVNEKVEHELYGSNSSKWGDDEANRKYLESKPELLEIYNDLVKRDEIYILFDKVKDLNPKDVESVLLFIKTIRHERGFED